MAAAVATLNIILGLAYFAVGTMSAIEMGRNHRKLGWSRFSIAWMAIALTCGSHHFAHGIHVAVEGRYVGGLDLVVTAIAVPAGVIWFLLRVEAFGGGRGDRFIHGSPWWVLALPTALGAYVTAVVMTMINDGSIAARGLGMAIPNILLIGVYAMIGFYLTRTQLHNRRPLGGWSLSGLSLAGIFLRGIYAADLHHLIVDWLSVPAGLYFLYVVRSLYRGNATDWNRMRAPRATAQPVNEAPTPAPAAARRPPATASSRSRG